MQMPIPQSGARGSPRTDIRQGSFAIIIAADTLVASVTRTMRPFTVMEKPSEANGFTHLKLRWDGLDFSKCNLVYNSFLFTTPRNSRTVRSSRPG